MVDEYNRFIYIIIIVIGLNDKNILNLCIKFSLLTERIYA